MGVSLATLTFFWQFAMAWWHYRNKVRLINFATSSVTIAEIEAVASNGMANGVHHVGGGEANHDQPEPRTATSKAQKIIRWMIFDLMLFLALVGNVSYFRGVWNVLDGYFLPGKKYVTGNRKLTDCLCFQNESCRTG